MFCGGISFMTQSVWCSMYFLYLIGISFFRSGRFYSILLKIFSSLLTWFFSSFIPIFLDIVFSQWPDSLGVLCLEILDLMFFLTKVSIYSILSQCLFCLSSISYIMMSVSEVPLQVPKYFISSFLSVKGFSLFILFLP